MQIRTRSFILLVTVGCFLSPLGLNADDGDDSAGDASASAGSAKPSDAGPSLGFKNGCPKVDCSSPQTSKKFIDGTLWVASPMALQGPGHCMGGYRQTPPPLFQYPEVKSAGEIIAATARTQLTQGVLDKVNAFMDCQCKNFKPVTLNDVQARVTAKSVAIVDDEAWFTFGTKVVSGKTPEFIKANFHGLYVSCMDAIYVPKWIAADAQKDVVAGHEFLHRLLFLANVQGIYHHRIIQGPAPWGLGWGPIAADGHSTNYPDDHFPEDVVDASNWAWSGTDKPPAFNVCEEDTLTCRNRRDTNDAQTAMKGQTQTRGPAAAAGAGNDNGLPVPADQLKDGTPQERAAFDSVPTPTTLPPPPQ